MKRKREGEEMLPQEERTQVRVFISRNKGSMCGARRFMTYVHGYVWQNGRRTGMLFGGRRESAKSYEAFLGSMGWTCLL